MALIIHEFENTPTRPIGHEKFNCQTSTGEHEFDLGAQPNPIWPFQPLVQIQGSQRSAGQEGIDNLRLWIWLIETDWGLAILREVILKAIREDREIRRATWEGKIECGHPEEKYWSEGEAYCDLIEGETEANRWEVPPDQSPEKKIITTPTQPHLGQPRHRSPTQVHERHLTKLPIQLKPQQNRIPHENALRFHCRKRQRQIQETDWITQTKGQDLWTGPQIKRPDYRETEKR